MVGSLIAHTDHMSGRAYVAGPSVNGAGRPSWPMRPVALAITRRGLIYSTVVDPPMNGPNG
jgi:hypothetical protein